MDNYPIITRRMSSRSKWGEIARQLNQGNNGYIDIGDEISFELKDGRSITVVAAGFTPYEGGSIAFVMRDSLEDLAMNDTNTSIGGWRDCKVNAYAEQIFALLPDDLQAVITPRTIKQVDHNGTQIATQSRLWIPSFTEVFGGTYDRDIDDVQFQIFTDDKSRVKAMDGVPCYWWLRSPYGGMTFRFVSRNGDWDDNFAEFSYGVVLSFIIKSKIDNRAA